MNEVISTLPEESLPLEDESIEIESIVEESENHINIDQLYNLLTDLQESAIFEDHIDSIQLAVSNNSSNLVHFDSNYNIWILEVDNQKYHVLFPKNADLVCLNDKIVNLSSQNIIGVVVNNNDELSLDSYHQKFFTILPTTNSSSNNNIYRYSASSYYTTYSPSGSGTTLGTTQVWCNPDVVKKPRVGIDSSSFEIAVICLLLLLAFINVTGGLLRK